LSWARHFYLESQEDIDKEIKELRGKSYIKQSVNKPVTRKETKPDKKELKIYNDKGKVVKAIQESLFS
jgi:outer membrane protein assembly factor BamE (lipoprotein component of BamABCDE complex)